MVFLFGFTLGILMYFFVKILNKTKKAITVTKKEEILCVGKYTEMKDYCLSRYVLVFYKGVTKKIKSETLYNFAKEHNKIVVNVTKTYINGKDISFDIEPLSEAEYIKIYGDNEDSDADEMSEEDDYDY